MKTGFSLYLGSGIEKNTAVIEKSVASGSNMVFTSLHIPEEKVADYRSEVKQLLEICKKHQCEVMVDVSNNTINKLGVKSLKDLKEWGFTHLRIDFGISVSEIAELTKDFYIVLNASTILEQELSELSDLQVDFGKFLACHNFFPKPLTGISISDCKARNNFLKKYGMKTMAFVAGDQDLRGPIFAGLPTCEEHRAEPVDVAMLDLFMNAHCDVVCIGDIDLKPETYQQILRINQGYVAINVEFSNDLSDEDLERYSYLKNSIHYDRVDSSECLFRSVQSRQAYYKTEPLPPRKRTVGDICISNSNYLRYEGELEIMKIEQESDPRVNVIGKVKAEDLKLFSLIKNGFGLQLKFK